MGKLVFVTSIIKPGRCLLRRLINATLGENNPQARRYISPHIKEDLRLWLSFFKDFNGQQVMKKRFGYHADSINLGTDSCKAGYAGTFGSKWFYGSFPDAWKKRDIKVLELYPIFLLIEVFGHLLKDSKVTFVCDNITIVDSINKYSSSSKEIMSLLRPLILKLLHLNIIFKAIHIQGKSNKLCDALSRGQTSPALLQRHGMEKSPTPVPARLRPANFAPWGGSL